MIAWHSGMPLLFLRLLEGNKFGARMAASTCLRQLLRTPAKISSHTQNFVLFHTDHNMYVFNPESGLMSGFLTLIVLMWRIG